MAMCWAMLPPYVLIFMVSQVESLSDNSLTATENCARFIIKIYRGECG